VADDASSRNVVRETTKGRARNEIRERRFWTQKSRSRTGTGTLRITRYVHFYQQSRSLFGNPDRLVRAVRPYRAARRTDNYKYNCIHALCGNAAPLYCRYRARSICMAATYLLAPRTTQYNNSACGTRLNRYERTRISAFQMRFV